MQKRPPGRPRTYPAHLARDGAPHLTVRLAPDALERVRDLGGSRWVRALIEKALADLDLETNLVRALNASPPPPAVAPAVPPSPVPRKTPESPLAPQPKVMKVAVWMRVENNSKFVRGKTRAREEIEQDLFSCYRMEKPGKSGWDYVLSIPYTTDDELNRTIDEIYREAASIADLRNCFTEIDINPLDNSERSW